MCVQVFSDSSVQVVGTVVGHFPGWRRPSLPEVVDGARATISFSNSSKKITLGVNGAEFTVEVIESIPFGFTRTASVGTRTYVLKGA